VKCNILKTLNSHVKHIFLLLGKLPSIQTIIKYYIEKVKKQEK